MQRRATLTPVFGTRGDCRRFRRVYVEHRRSSRTAKKTERR
jgi:hypothetical protein